MPLAVPLARVRAFGILSPMLDIRRETLLRLSAAQRWLNSRGVEVRAVSTLYRWVEDGRLEVVRIGGILYTSEEALQRMAESAGPEPVRPKQTRRQRPRIDRRRQELAAQELEAAGW